MSEFSVFSYKGGNSFIHRIPAWIKILYIPFFNVLIFSLSWQCAAAAFVLHIILFCAVKFSVKEQWNDFKPALYYAVFLYILNFITAAMVMWGTLDLLQVFINSIKAAVTDKETAVFVIKFSACVQSCSLMFKTCTSLELREGVEIVESAVRKVLPVKKEPVFAGAVSQLILFIPAVFKIWNQIVTAWTARHGKKGIRMFMVLIPVLFSVGLKYAWDTSRAIINRRR